MSRQFSWGGSLVARLEFRRGCHLCPGGLPTLAWLHRKDLVKDGAVGGLVNSKWCCPSTTSARDPHLVGTPSCLCEHKSLVRNKGTEQEVASALSTAAPGGVLCRTSSA